MRILEHYWMSNKDWWYLDKNLDMRIKPDAPKEAQESYKRYLEQMKKDNLLYFKKDKNNEWKVYYKFYSENNRLISFSYK